MTDTQPLPPPTHADIANVLSLLPLWPCGAPIKLMAQDLFPQFHVTIAKRKVRQCLAILAKNGLRMVRKTDKENEPGLKAVVGVERVDWLRVRPMWEKLRDE